MTDRASEARLEVALAQAIINEVKYGPETSQLAEISLLAAFTNRSIGERLAHALHVLLPGVKYLSFGALLKDGVVMRTSDLAVVGSVDIRPQTLRGSAARVAARKNTTFHTKMRSGDSSSIKYYELQEAWDQTNASSVLSVPIPAVRAYESASIVETQPQETASDPASHVCPVLHNINGAIGIVTLGLDSELNSKQARAFQGLAQSLSPFLAYYAAPVLQQQADQIHEVAAANAVSMARMKARQHAAHDTGHQAQPPEHVSRPSLSAISPFSAFAPPRSSDEGDSKGTSSPRAASSGQPGLLKDASPEQSKEGNPNHAQRLGTNPFAQAAAAARHASSSEAAGHAHVSPKKCTGPGSESRQQPISPFAAAAQASGRLFSQHLSNTDQVPSPPPAMIDIPGGQQHASGQPQTSSEQTHQSNSGSGSSSHGMMSGSADHSDLNDALSDEQAAVPRPQEELSEDETTALDTAFVFKRRPLLAAHQRRYSTSTFLQGVLHTPIAHFSPANMPGLTEESSGNIGEQQQQAQQYHQQQQKGQQTLIVDDYTYAAASQSIERRALSTPQDCATECAIDDEELHCQLLARASCPGPILYEAVWPSDNAVLDPSTRDSAAQTHLMLQGQFDRAGRHQGVVFGTRTSIEYSRLHMLPQKAGSEHANPSRFREASPDSHLEEAAATPDKAPALPARDSPRRPSLVEEAAGALSLSISQHASTFKETVRKESDALHLSKRLKQVAAQQHPLWMTFSEPKLEHKFKVWFGRKCSKVDTIFMLAATIYITQLLFFTWALQDQQTHKWPLVGYAMLPIILLQHGDESWYLKHRCVILGSVRLLLLAFLAFVVPHVAQQHAKSCHNWLHLGSLGPLLVIPLGLMVRFKHHIVLHAVSCASIVMQGLQACKASSGSGWSWQAASMQRLAIATCAPSLLLYLVEMRARAVYLHEATK